MESKTDATAKAVQDDSGIALATSKLTLVDEREEPTGSAVVVEEAAPAPNEQIDDVAQLESFEDLTLVLSKDYLVQTASLLSQVHIAAAIRRISFVMPPSDQAYAPTRAEELYDDLADILALVPNVYVAEFTRLGELQNPDIWPLDNTDFFWEVVLTALAETATPIETLTNVPIHDIAGNPRFPECHNGMTTLRILISRLCHWSVFRRHFCCGTNNIM